MHYKYLYIPAFLLFVAVVVSAQPAGPRAVTPPGLDGRFVELARQVPGFGGYFFDGQGDLNVYVTEFSQEETARAAVGSAARQRPERSQQPWSRPAEIVVRRGDFDFLQLYEWRTRLTSVMTTPGVQQMDINEAVNRISIGVTEENARPRVLAQLDALGVPRDAVIIEVVPRVVQLSTLNDYVRPLVGGLEINFLDGLECTLGVNVWYTNLAAGVPVGSAGFFTASHCSSTRAATDGTVFSQGGSRIGYEMWDPPFFTRAQNTLCPRNVGCRWSDVAFAVYDAGVSRTQGAMARTEYSGWGSFQGSKTIVGDRTLNGTAYPVMGAYFDKVGRTTGWTSGPVVNTCFDVNVLGATYLCQGKVDAMIRAGDSGSPVFQWTGQTTGAFAGIAWGGVDRGPGFFFSNIERIQADMGNGITYGPN